MRFCLNSQIRLSKNTDLISWDLGDGEDVDEAMLAFMKKHSSKVILPEFFTSFGFAKEDKTVSMTM
jgi:hypothetical protein